MSSIQNLEFEKMTISELRVALNIIWELYDNEESIAELLRQLMHKAEESARRRGILK